MKNILIILLFLSYSVTGQTFQKGVAVTLNAGTAGYVTINGQDYTRGSLQVWTNYNDTVNGKGTYDSTFAILYTRNGSLMLYPTLDTFFIYGDSTNKVCRNAAGLKTWFRTNLNYVGY